MDHFCKNCGTKLNEGEKFCTNCGSKVNTTPVSNTNTSANTENDINKFDKTNPSAIVGFICSIVGLFIAGIPMGIIAVCSGLSARNHIKVFKNEKGAGLALAAFIIGIIDIVLASIAIVFMNI